MKILIISPGKWKKSPEKELFENYCKRLPWKLELHELDVKQHSDIAKHKAREAEKINQAIQQFNPHIKIALDERGKELDSKGWANIFNTSKSKGDSKIAFIIGGHAGIDDSISSGADIKLSLGKMTWPHLLVRAMLAEQIYRSWSITEGHPYHRK